MSEVNYSMRLFPSLLGQEKTMTMMGPLEVFKIHNRNQVRLAIKMCRACHWNVPYPSIRCCHITFWDQWMCSVPSSIFEQNSRCSFDTCTMHMKIYDIMSYRNALSKIICDIFRLVDRLNWFEVYMNYDHQALPPTDETDIFYVHDLDFYKSFLYQQVSSYR